MHSLNNKLSHSKVPFRQKNSCPIKGSRRFTSIKKQFIDHLHRCANGDILWELERALPLMLHLYFALHILQHVRKAWQMCVPLSPYSVEPFTHHLKGNERSSGAERRDQVPASKDFLL
ncbi:hypothetical protein CEXT_444331 [Caerostris extrusa]|uniref:Uncharacterized protein n=1 Tax=Caerostris extrusa TaxID=172846 RepID=A0AAV4XK68_CAEEX|nr:hypothetical protein CEXT_444331 [Caerostris extrusa]